MTDGLGVQTVPRIPFAMLRLSLDEARNNVLVPLPLAADAITVMELYRSSPNVKITLRLNYQDASPIPVYQMGQMIRLLPGPDGKIPRVYKIYVTNDRDPGGYVVLGIGGEAGIELSVGQTVLVSEVSSPITVQRIVETANVHIAFHSLSNALISVDTPLLAGATYHSPWANFQYYAEYAGTIVMDTNGVIMLEQSQDGQNVDADEVLNYTANSKQGFYGKIVAPYARLTIQNTTENDQTLLRAFVRGRPV